jgi:Protein of unknown function (DUF3716)
MAYGKRARKRCDRCKSDAKRHFQDCKTLVGYSSACGNCLLTHHPEKCSLRTYFLFISAVSLLTYVADPDFQKEPEPGGDRYPVSSAPTPNMFQPGKRAGTRASHRTASGGTTMPDMTSNYLPLRQNQKSVFVEDGGNEEERDGDEVYEDALQ